MTTSSSKVNSEINVTPFLDVLLVLIITFLAAMSARKTLDAQLPEPCAAGCQSSSVPIVLEVLGDGTFLLNRAAIMPDKLMPTLERLFAGRPGQVLNVAGHGDASYQQVLTAMDASRTAGVKVISIPPSDSYSGR